MPVEPPNLESRFSLMNRTSVLINFALLAAVLTSALAGCGYSLRKGPPVTAVSIGRIENNTYEPRLQDFLYDALTEELMKQGVRVDDDADYRIEGVLNAFEIRGAAEKDKITVQYEVIIKGMFHLVGPDGARRPLRERAAFIVTFGGQGALELLTAGKELAVERALNDMSREIAASVVQMR